jgi:hypothetical protein
MKCLFSPCRHLVAVDRAWYIFQQQGMVESVPTILLQMYLDQIGSFQVHGDETRREPFAPKHTVPAMQRDKYSARK